MSANRVLSLAVTTMASMFILNQVASAAGGTTRSIIKGEQGFFDRLLGK